MTKGERMRQIQLTILAGAVAAAMANPDYVPTLVDPEMRAAFDKAMLQEGRKQRAWSSAQPKPSAGHVKALIALMPDPPMSAAAQVAEYEAEIYKQSRVERVGKKIARGMGLSLRDGK